MSTDRPVYFHLLHADCYKDPSKEKDEYSLWRIWGEQEKRRHGTARVVVDHWEPKLHELFNESTEYYNENSRISALEKEIESLKKRITKLEENKCITVPIQTFAPEPYELLKPLHIVLEQNEDEFTASFFDANLGTSGDTQGEAIDNLKDLIIATFEILKEPDKSELGPGPLHQLEVLEEFLRRIS